jgi:hypothetical protein
MCRRNESSPLCEPHPEFGAFVTLEFCCNLTLGFVANSP